MNCPQCNHAEFVRISDSLSRCASCRWLVRVQADGSVKSMVDPYRPLSKRPRKVRLHRRAVK